MGPDATGVRDDLFQSLKTILGQLLPPCRNACKTRCVGTVLKDSGVEEVAALDPSSAATS